MVVFVLTLLVYITPTTQVLLVINIAKAKFPNKKEDFFKRLFDFVLEREIIAKFSTYLVIDYFWDLKEW